MTIVETTITIKHVIDADGVRNVEMDIQCVDEKASAVTVLGMLSYASRWAWEEWFGIGENL